MGEVHRGRPAIKAFAQGTFDLLPEFTIEQRSLLGGERWAAVEWVMTGTDRATGKRFSVRGVSVMELEGGKIRRNSDYWNMADLLRQTGALPQDQGSGSKNEALIASVMNAWVAAYERGDARAVADLFTEDGIYAANTGELLRGRAAASRSGRDRPIAWWMRATLWVSSGASRMTAEPAAVGSPQRKAVRTMTGCWNPTW